LHRPSSLALREHSSGDFIEYNNEYQGSVKIGVIFYQLNGHQMHSNIDHYFKKLINPNV